MANRDFDYDRERMRGYDERDRASDYGRERDSDRNWADRDRNRTERGALARGTDEVRSWFGDDQAQRRRDLDEIRDRNRGRDRYGERDWSRDERGWSGESRDRGWASDYGRGERGYSAAREWGGERFPSDEPGWSTRDRYAQSGTMRPRGDEFTRPGTDYGDYYRPSRFSYGGSTAGGGYAREDWGGGRSTEFEGDTWRSRSNFSGRGPRNYRRSDERIREDVNERLTHDPRIDASDIEVEVNNGEVTLRGRVDERRTRRLAEECIEDLPGVRDVKNEIKAEGRNREDGSIGHEGNPLQRDDRTTLNLSDAERQRRK